MAKKTEDKEKHLTEEIDRVAVIDAKDDGAQAVKRLLKSLAGAGFAAEPATLAETITARFPPETRDKVLRDLIAREAAERFEETGKVLEHMNDLVPQAAEGAYPYANGYDNDLYEEELYGLQIELLKLQKDVKEKGKKVIILFEGRDAAGKGGTIQRFVENMNPRGARIVALAKPTDAEKGQWFFQRYVNQLPSPGEIVFFDRSWYNRAVVEPVMGFCTKEQTELFLREVLNFEKASSITASSFLSSGLMWAVRNRSAGLSSARSIRCAAGSFRPWIWRHLTSGTNTPPQLNGCSARRKRLTHPGPLSAVMISAVHGLTPSAWC